MEWFSCVPSHRIGSHQDTVHRRLPHPLVWPGQIQTDWWASRKHFTPFFPKQVYLWGSILEKNRLDTLVGALGLVGARIWPCWARWAGLGVGFGSAGRAGMHWLGWAWCWACWARGWVGRGVGRAGRAGWVGRGVGRAGRVGRGVGRGVWPCWARWAGLGRGVWPCWARWLGWAWCSK